MYKPVLKYVLNRLRPTRSKNSSVSINYFSNSPCFMTVLIIFPFASFKRSTFLLKIYRLAAPSRFLLPHSCVNSPLLDSKTSNIDATSSCLIISGVPFIFVFLAAPHSYKLKKVLLKPNSRFTKRCKTKSDARFSP